MRCKAKVESLYMEQSPTLIPPGTENQQPAYSFLEGEEGDLFLEILSRKGLGIREIRSTEDMEGLPWWRSG